MTKSIILAIIVVAWILIPTFTPDDIITFWLMRTLGGYYWLAVGTVLLLMWHYKITFKKIKDTIFGLFKK